MTKKSRTFRPPDTSAKPATPAPSTPSAGDPTAGSAATQSATDLGQAGTAGTAADAAPTASQPSPTRPSTTSTTTTRSAARRRATAAAPRQQSFFERYRTILIAGAAAVVLGLVAFAFLSSANTRAFECESLLTPGPTDPVPTPRPTILAPSVSPGSSPAASAVGSPGGSAVASPAASADPAASPAASAASVDPAALPASSPEADASPQPQPTQELGFVTQDHGKQHVNPGTTIDYAFCPPTSGSHWNIAGRAPLARAFYDPNAGVIPPQWIHNLEHGYALILYKGDPGPEVLEQLRGVMDDAEQTEGALQCGQPNKVIVARFDEMDAAFAAVAWDRALLLSEVDTQQLLTFVNQWADGRQRPENAC